MANCKCVNSGPKNPVAPASWGIRESASIDYGSGSVSLNSNTGMVTLNGLPGSFTPPSYSYAGYMSLILYCSNGTSITLDNWTTINGGPAHSLSNSAQNSCGASTNPPNTSTIDNPTSCSRLAAANPSYNIAWTCSDPQPPTVPPPIPPCGAGGDGGGSGGDDYSSIMADVPPVNPGSCLPCNTPPKPLIEVGSIADKIQQLLRSGEYIGPNSGAGNNQVDNVLRDAEREAGRRARAETGRAITDDKLKQKHLRQILQERLLKPGSIDGVRPAPQCQPKPLDPGRKRTPPTKPEAQPFRDTGKRRTPRRPPPTGRPTTGGPVTKIPGGGQGPQRPLPKGPPNWFPRLPSLPRNWIPRLPPLPPWPWFTLPTTLPPLPRPTFPTIITRFPNPLTPIIIVGEEVFGRDGGIGRDDDLLNPKRDWDWVPPYPPNDPRRFDDWDMNESDFDGPVSDYDPPAIITDPSTGIPNIYQINPSLGIQDFTSGVVVPFSGSWNPSNSTKIYPLTNSPGFDLTANTPAIVNTTPIRSEISDDNRGNRLRLSDTIATMLAINPEIPVWAMYLADYYPRITTSNLYRLPRAKIQMVSNGTGSKDLIAKASDGTAIITTPFVPNSPSISIDQTILSNNNISASLVNMQLLEVYSGNPPLSEPTALVAKDI